MARAFSFCSSDIFLSHFGFGLDAKFLTIHDDVRETEREVLRTKQPSRLPAVLTACYQAALDAKGRYRIGGGQITPGRSYLDQGGTTPLLRAYAIDCPRCSC